ncbi:MAG TPA: glycosyltransferase family 1 protein [Candidatus Limnocylindrales bacterium]|nr:glycosyltransferase family 1 protein [Candidatus Limnocylindrales bacterium]
MSPRLSDLATPEAPTPGTRVVIDLRPLQEPERTPITAAYLDRLLRAFAAEPLAGESFVALLRTLRADPADGLESLGLPVAGRRRVPPTSRVFRSAGLTLDAFLLRGAEVGTAWGTAESGAAGVVFHTAGGAVPLGSRLPVVATVLDLAPWELPEVYARSGAARFGHRLRARILHDARKVIVCSEATAASARRRLHLRPDQLSVVPLAADPEFALGAGEQPAVAALRARLALPARYVVFCGRYDARKDVATLLRALAGLRTEQGSGPGWPPHLVLARDPSGEGEEPGLLRSVEQHGVADLVHLPSQLSSEELATLLAGARGFVYPARSEGTGLRVIEALACGTPVIASRTGPLPEIVGRAGIIVEPGDAARLAAALRALWEGPIREQLVRAARRAARGPRRTWSDVARETRRVYAAAADGPGSLPSH